MEQIFQHVELSEKDYFGLQFVQQPGDVVVSLILPSTFQNLIKINLLKFMFDFTAMA